jgi:hypothetical protein
MKTEGCIVGIETMPNSTNIVLIFILFCDYIISTKNLIAIFYTSPIKGAFKVSLDYNLQTDDCSIGTRTMANTNNTNGNGV